MKGFVCLITLLSLSLQLSAMDQNNLQTLIVGRWVAENLGDFSEYGFTQPADIEFTSDGRYIEKVQYHGHVLFNSGSYKIYHQSGHFNIEQTVARAGGEGWDEYVRSINHANASGLGIGQRTQVFPFARETGKNTGFICIEESKLYIKLYLPGFLPPTTTREGARIYKKCR